MTRPEASEVHEFMAGLGVFADPPICACGEDIDDPIHTAAEATASEPRRDSNEPAQAVPFEEQRQRAREHYERISDAAGEWSSFVRDAIEAAAPPSEATRGEPNFLYVQMADDYGGMSAWEFEDKYPDWYPKHDAGLRAEFARRKAAAQPGEPPKPDPLDVLDERPWPR